VLFEELASASSGSRFTASSKITTRTGDHLPAYLKNVLGRKMGIKDTEGVTDLLRYGLLRGSFVFRDRREAQIPMDLNSNAFRCYTMIISSVTSIGAAESEKGG
jgi:hypothetical protein